MTANVTDEEGLTVGDTDYFSDDSSFYGDEDGRKEWEDRAATFDPAIYWSTHHHYEPSVLARRNIDTPSTLPVRSATGPVRESSLSNALLNVDVVNHGQSESSSLQNTESLTAFLARLPPSTIRDQGLWISIENPHSYPRGPSQRDRDGFVQAGKEILSKLQIIRHGLKTRKPATNLPVVVRGVLGAARQAGHTSGSWLIHSPLEHVDLIWSLVAVDTLAGRLGYAARVATIEAPDSSSEVKQRISVYTEDFDDVERIRGVVSRLEGILKSCRLMTRVGELYYKPEAYSDLDIRTGNKWGLKSSLYSRKDLVANAFDDPETDREN